MPPVAMPQIARERPLEARRRRIEPRRRPSANGAQRQGPRMLAFLLRRVLSAIPVMAIVAVVIFGLLHLAEGGPAAVIAGDGASREDVAQIERQLGLDRPLLEQFVLWLGRIVDGDLGTSIFFKVPVLDLIVQNLEPTLSL